MFMLVMNVRGAIGSESTLSFMGMGSFRHERLSRGIRGTKLEINTNKECVKRTGKEIG